jgi:hypothetical protein
MLARQLLVVPPSHTNVGEGWDGGVSETGIAPIPAFPRRRVKEQFSECLNKSHQTHNTTLAYEKRLKTSVPLVPPKPNEFDSATSIFISRATFAQ